MKKQIVYASFIPRIFSTMMDLIVVSILLLPVAMIVNRRVLIHKFGDIFAAKNIDINDYQAIQDAIQSPEFIPYSGIETAIELALPMFIIQTIIIVLYFIIFWHKYSVTPVKYIMRMRVVDALSFNRPTIFQSIKRCIGYMFFPIGMWSIFFTKQKQMFHDKISGTVVIKK